MLARCLLGGANPQEIRIFYSYARGDADFRSMIDDVLGKFRWDVAVRTWYDGAIPAGAEWDQEIFRNLDIADFVLLFVTKSFVQSDYCMSVEMPRALERHERGDVRVIPIIIQETEPDWRTLAFAKLQVLPQNGLPIEKWVDPERAIQNVIQGIVNIIAHANLELKSLCNWQLYLDGTMTEFSLAEENSVVEELRQLTGDSTLRPVAIGAGSIVMYMESTRNALACLQEWLVESEPARIGRYRALRIVELFGAGLHAFAGDVDLLSGVGPVHPPGPEALLFPSPPYEPMMLKGLQTSKTQPLAFQKIVDTGHSGLNGAAFVAEAQKLLDYFLTAVAVPENELWVNLAPNESNRMLGESLRGTRMGRVLLDQDYHLKRLSASLLHPDSECGREFWHRLVGRAHKEIGRTDLQYNVFQRVWIVPTKAVVYEGLLPRHGDFNDLMPLPEEADTQAFVVERQVRLVCNDEYLEMYGNTADPRNPRLDELSSATFKEIVLPLIDKEVNEGKTFAPIRQIYNCLILAAWFKEKYRAHPVLQKYIDSGNPGQLLARINTISTMDWLGKKEDVAERDSGTSTPHTSLPKNKEVDAETDEEMVSFDRGIQLRESGHLDDSERILRSVVNVRTRLHGEEAHLTLVAMSQLGRTLRAMGRIEEAHTLHQHVLDIRRRVLGEEHVFTQNSMNILADTLLAMGRGVAARRLQAEATASKIRTSDAYEIEENKEYFERYLDIFRNGVFYLHRDEYDSLSSQRVTRAYFAGAIDLRSVPLRVL